MYKEIIELLEQEKGLARDMLLLLENGQMEAKNLTSQIVNMGKMIAMLDKCIPASVYMQYKDFFAAFSIFCNNCNDRNFLRANKEQLSSSLEVFVDCMEELQHSYLFRMKKCPCCDNVVMYNPLPDYYNEMQERYHMPAVKGETLNS